jgi:hypothetical protein
MKMTRLIYLLILCLISSSGFGQKLDLIKVLPGFGIVFNNDSIKLEKTSIEEIYRILNIIDDGNSYLTLNDGIDLETRAEISWTEIVKEINYKSIIFKFTGENDSDTLKLTEIRIKEDKSIKTYLENELEIGMINPQIEAFYSLVDKLDYISDNGLVFYLNSYGITINLEKMVNENLKLTEISIHLRLK